MLAGAGDYPVALLGSGVMAPGMASDVTGTSTIITLLHEAPVIDAQVSNVATVEGNWGSLTLLDAGGDAVRWARRAFHANRRGYDEVTRARRRGPRRGPAACSSCPTCRASGSASTATRGRSSSG